MRVLLFSAPRPNSNETAMHMGDGRPPMGLAYLSAYLAQFDIESKIVDLYHFGGGHTGEKPSGMAICAVRDNADYVVDIFDEIEKYKPDYLGMYLGTVSFYVGIELSKKIRERYPDLPLIVGGPHATEMPNSLIRFFDYVVCGEGEIALLDIVSSRVKSKGIVHGTIVDDINLLPFPDYKHYIGKPYNWNLELFGGEVDPVLAINSTRGCPFSCMFCGVANTKFRGITPTNLVKYIFELKSRYGAKGIYFREDNFTVQAKRVEEFCDLLISENADIRWACESRVKNLSSDLIEKMAKSGCMGLYIGVESGSSKILKYVKKGETREDFLKKFPIIHANGISTYTTWINGLPNETEEDRNSNIELCEKLNPTVADRQVYLGQPGSDFYRMLDAAREFEFKEPSGIFYIKGFLHLARQLYGEDDPRTEYVKKLYETNKIRPYPLEPYYISDTSYRRLGTTRIREQLSVKTPYPTESYYLSEATYRQNRVTNTSVVIRCRNEEQWVGHAIQSVLDSISDPEIVVVDNGSKDGSMNVVKLFESFCDVRTISVDDYYPGKALNTAIGQCKQKNVLVLSAHCVISKFDEMSLINLLKKYVAVFGKQVPIYKGKKISTRYVWENFPNESHVNMWSDKENRYFLHNAFAAYNRDFVLMNPFDETLCGKEDRYWVSEAIKQGESIFYDPTLECQHHWTQNGATWRNV